MTLSQKYTPEAIAERRHELERMEQLWAENRNLRTMNAKLVEALEKSNKLLVLVFVDDDVALEQVEKNEAALAEAKELEHAT